MTDSYSNDHIIYKIFKEYEEYQLSLYKQAVELSIKNDSYSVDNYLYALLLKKYILDNNLLSNISKKTKLSYAITCGINKFGFIRIEIRDCLKEIQLIYSNIQ